MRLQRRTYNEAFHHEMNRGTAGRFLASPTSEVDKIQRLGVRFTCPPLDFYFLDQKILTIFQMEVNFLKSYFGQE
jgi:hypothetical protein